MPKPVAVSQAVQVKQVTVLTQPTPAVPEPAVVLEAVQAVLFVAVIKQATAATGSFP